MSLRVGDATPVKLDATSRPFVFPGDMPTHAQVLHGPVEDLNVFVRRGHVTASLERLHWSGVCSRRVSGGTFLVLLRASGVQIGCGVSKLGSLQINDAVRIDTTVAAVINLSVQEHAIAYLVRLVMHGPAQAPVSDGTVP
jgi:environmental stress-induced protein Ves